MLAGQAVLPDLSLVCELGIALFYTWGNFQKTLCLCNTLGMISWKTPVQATSGAFIWLGSTLFHGAFSTIVIPVLSDALISHQALSPMKKWMEMYLPLRARLFTCIPIQVTRMVSYKSFEFFKKERKLGFPDREIYSNLWWISVQISLSNQNISSNMFLYCVFLLASIKALNKE